MRKIINIALALVLLAGLCVPAAAAGTTFTDVSHDKWYYTWVTKAAQAGWVSGVGGGKYEPGKSVTYSQFAVMLDRALYSNESDAQPKGDYWWTPACEVADKHGLFADTDMANRSDWTAVANQPIEREQMAQMMYNALVDVGAKLPTYEEYTEVSLHINDIIDCENDEAVAVCYTLRLLTGTGNGYFDPHNPMTRAQAAVVLCNIYGYVTGDVTGSTTTPNEPDVPDEPEKPTQPDVPRPAGAVGGHYDTSKYTVPADANKDGWLTEDEVAAVIAQIMEEYPVGTPWGEDKFYRGTGWPNGGYACAAFAQMASDRIFGNLPKRVQRDVYSIRIGDVTQNKQPHWGVIQKIWWYDEDPSQSATYTIDGNVGGKIGLGGDSYDMLEASIKSGGLTIWTRYPVGTNTPSTLEVGTITYKRGETTNTEGASFITTCLDTPTWSSETKEKARKIMADMTLEEKVGQLFLLHYPKDGAGSVSDATDLINKYHPGGYLVFAAMFEGNTTAGVQKKIADTQAASDIPLLFTVDEEGGLAASGRRIVRISDKSQYGHDPFLSPQELKEKGGLSAVAADTIDKASFLKNLGLNVNHAPVADVSAPGGMMYGRTWGGTALETAEYVETLVGAADGTGVGTTMKHFPGYGATSADTHNGFAINDLSLEDFLYGDLLPFHAGIGAGGRAVMVTHNTINCLDTGKPAIALKGDRRPFL